MTFAKSKKQRGGGGGGHNDQLPNLAKTSIAKVLRLNAVVYGKSECPPPVIRIFNTNTTKPKNKSEIYFTYSIKIL